VGPYLKNKLKSKGIGGVLIMAILTKTANLKH
jgi:hypothetical protein